jgi:sugar lactone lactonase YvrE
MTNKLITLVVVIISAACSSTPVAKHAPVFYPEPPAPSRIQYLTSLTGEKDLGAERSAFEKFVTGAKETENRLDKPYGVAIHAGKIYVCDTNRTVMVFDLDNKTFGPLAGAQGLGKLPQPLNISIDAEANKYVSDPVRSQVVVFDKNDLYVTAFGVAEGWKPVDAVPFEDRLYVADMKNKEIVVFDRKTGDLINKFGQTGEGPELLSLPTNITFDRHGYLYVSDAGRFQILKYDRDGHLQGAFGQLGRSSTNFARPRGIAVDRDDRIYAVDAAFDNVQILHQTGQFLLDFGKAGSGPGDLYLPAKIFIDYDNKKYFERFADPQFEIDFLLFVTSQFGNRMVNVYGVGKQRGQKYPSDDELLQQLKERIEKQKPQETPDQPAADAEKK